MAAAGLYYLSRHQAEQTRRVGLELSRSVANAVGTELRGTINILEALSTSPTLDTREVAQFERRASRIVAMQPNWVGMNVVDPAGVMVIDTRADAPGVIDRASLDHVMVTRSATVGRLVKGPQGDWQFAVRVPVMRAGELSYVLTAMVKPDAIHQVITRQAVPDDWVISIIDQSDVRLARSRAHAETLGGRMSPTAEQVLAQGGPEGFGISYTLEGDRIYTPFSRIEPMGWRAVLGMPTAAVDAAAFRTIAVLGGGVLLSIVLGTLGALSVARRITQPIAALRAAADALGRREVPEPPMTSLAEVNDVGAALNRAGSELARFAEERERLLESERVARRAAEAADRAKERFMAVLSHELRTPLNAVYGWARLLQTNQLTDPAQIARANDAIIRNADAQVRLIDDLLDLSRISSGKMRLSLQPVKMSDVIQGALDAIRPSAEQKGIRITVVSDDGSGLVAGDSARLQQIVWNLLANAVKFTANGGEVRLHQQRSNGHIELTVTDNGEGIDPATLPHIFEAFRQGDDSTTRVHGGLGLGLALVRQLTELHGGEVTAQSEGPGRGATFTVRLPRATSVAAATHVQPIAPALTDKELASVVRLDGVRIVVADDEPDALILTRTILTSAGADVQTCSSAGAALELLERHQPHVLVSDLEMPGEDGYSLIRKVRARGAEAGGAIPAIALSAYGRPEDRMRAVAAGFSMHVPKPADPGELTAIIAGVAGKSDVRPSSPQGKMPISM